MTRGPVFSLKLFADAQPKFGGAVPTARIFLPQDATGSPIRLAATAGRRVAEARPRRTA